MSGFVGIWLVGATGEVWLAAMLWDNLVVGGSPGLPFFCKPSINSSLSIHLLITIRKSINK